MNLIKFQNLILISVNQHVNYQSFEYVTFYLFLNFVYLILINLNFITLIKLFIIYS
jgi:hypothetical protein